MRNLALFLKYDGTAYHGWQVQKNACSVAQTLEEAAADVVGHPVHMTGCGRTDAGVHARTYVANFRTESRIPVDRVAYALNTHLPADIVVTGAREVPLGFNAIGSCVRKEYTYQIYNSRIRDPFFVNRAWFYPKHLDEAVMQEAAAQFVGTHDFAAVRSVGTDVKTTVRTVYYFDVERRGELILLRVCANGFLYNMVRAMTGTVVYAAEGKIRPQDIGRILESGNRTAAGPTVPPGGLYMTHLWYDDGGVAFDACPYQACPGSGAAEAAPPLAALSAGCADRSGASRRLPADEDPCARRAEALAALPWEKRGKLRLRQL